MHARKQGKIGFSKIYTPDHPILFTDRPLLKKPYIVFRCPLTDENSHDFLQSKLAKLGILHVVQGKKKDIMFVKITSNRKVILAIELFLKQTSRYPQKLNRRLYHHLLSYKNTCVQQQKNKPKKLPALKSKLYSNFIKDGNQAESKTAHTIYHVVKKDKPQSKYIYKENPTGRKISELETYNAFCYRLLLGDRHSKTRGIHTKQGENAGLVSKLFTHFESLHDRYYKFYHANKTYLSPSEEDLLNYEIVKIWVAAYVEKENDLHGGNYGKGPNGFYVKIDDDQSTWPLTSKYSLVDPLHGEPSLTYDVAPIKAFPIEEQDILTLPKLKYTHPRNWPDRSDTGLLHFDALVKEKKYIDDKYYMFLKRILIPDDAYEGIGLATVSSDKLRTSINEDKCETTKVLTQVLLDMTEFQNYVLANPHIIIKLITEFAEYNASYKKPEDWYLHLDLDQIQKNFDRIQNKIRNKRGLPSILEQSQKKSALVQLSIFNGKATPQNLNEVKDKVVNQDVNTSLASCQLF